MYFIWDNMFSKGTVPKKLNFVIFHLITNHQKLMELEKVFLATIKINLKQIKVLHNVNTAEIKETIMNNTNFNIFRKEFSFELSNELRQKYGGFSFKKKILHEKIFLKEKQMTFNEEPTQEKIPSSRIKF